MEVQTREDLKRIFRDWWPQFKLQYPEYATDYYDEVIGKMLNCGDPEVGRSTYICERCGETVRVPFSCKSCFCLSCGRKYMYDWVQHVADTRLPYVMYRHVIVTVPEEFRVDFYRRPELLKELPRSANACVVKMWSWQKKMPLEPAVIAVTQTAGRAGNYNPHVHMLVTSGGLDANGEWADMGYVDYDKFHRLWRDELLDMLSRKIPEAREKIEACRARHPRGLVAHIKKEAVPDQGDDLVGYLAKYVMSPPIAVRRIVWYDGERVRYWYRDHKTSRRQTETVDVMQFIGRMVQHILPKGAQRIKYYGLHANHKRKDAKELVYRAIARARRRGELRSKPRRGRFSYRQRMLFTLKKDPLLCSRCGCEMVLLSIWHRDSGFIIDRFDELFQDVEDDSARQGDDSPRGSDAGTGQDRVVQLQLPLVWV